MTYTLTTDYYEQGEDGPRLIWAKGTTIPIDAAQACGLIGATPAPQPVIMPSEDAQAEAARVLANPATSPAAKKDAKAILDAANKSRRENG